MIHKEAMMVSVRRRRQVEERWRQEEETDRVRWRRDYPCNHVKISLTNQRGACHLGYTVSNKHVIFKQNCEI